MKLIKWVYPLLTIIVTLTISNTILALNTAITSQNQLPSSLSKPNSTINTFIISKQAINTLITANDYQQENSAIIPKKPGPNPLTVNPTQINELHITNILENNTISRNYRDELYNFLMAELALQQDKAKLALQYYLEVIKTSGNIKVAELALECAINNKALTEAIEIAELWAKLANNDINPQLIALTLLLDIFPEQAKTYLIHAAHLEPNNLDQYLLLTYSKLPAISQNNLYTLLIQLASQQANNPYIQLAAAQIAAQDENHIADAEKLLNNSLTLNPSLTHAIQLQAKLISYQNKQDLPALQYLQQQITIYPKNEELLLFYSNALLDNNDAKTAIIHLQQLTTSKTYGTEAKYVLAEAYLQEKQDNLAKKILLTIITDPIFGPMAKYALGQLYEQQNNLSEAVKCYIEVTSGKFHIIATLKAAFLLTELGEADQALDLIQNANPTTFLEQKQLLLVQSDLLIEMQEISQAMKLINDTLELLPYDVDLLYARSLIAGLLNQPEQAEQDLETILTIEPENANALNALGYVLANKPERTQDALSYLQKALELSPDNPAFMDSMAWVLFRNGKLQDSMSLLKDAYAISNDSEIAAHLGEVLWSSGKKTQAKKIWQKALKNTPNNNILLETLKRLHIQLDAFAN